MHTYSKPIDFIAEGEYWFLPSKISGVFNSSFILGKSGFGRKRGEATFRMYRTLWRWKE